MPLDGRARINQQRAFLMRQQLTDTTHVAKMAMLFQRRIVISGKIRGEMRPPVDQAEKDHHFGAHQQAAASFQNGDFGRRAVPQEVLGPP